MLDVHSVLHLMHLGLAVQSSRAASLRRRRRERERDCSHEDRPCARHAVSVTFDVSWTGCPLRQCCKCDSIISLAPAPDGSLQLVSRAEALGHNVRCRQ